MSARRKTKWLEKEDYWRKVMFFTCVSKGDSFTLGLPLLILFTQLIHREMSQREILKSGTVRRRRTHIVNTPHLHTCAHTKILNILWTISIYSLILFSSVILAASIYNFFVCVCKKIDIYI